MFKKLPETWDFFFFKKAHIELLEKKTTICDMKNALAGINGEVISQKKRLMNLKSVAREMIQNETPREKRIF